MSAVLQPRPGFNWNLIAWGGPDQRRTDRCSYCGDPFPEHDDFIPLILWRADGSAAEFCDHCQVAWFGIESFDHLDASEDDRDG